MSKVKFVIGAGPAGIAYPQAKFDPFGNKEYGVRLWKFMDYLNTVMPIWLKLARN